MKTFNTKFKIGAVYTLILFGHTISAQTETCDCIDGTPTREADLISGGSFCGTTTFTVASTFRASSEICWSSGTLTLTGNDGDVEISNIFQVTGGTVDLTSDTRQHVDILSGGHLIVGSGATISASDKFDVASGGWMTIAGTVSSERQEIIVAAGGNIEVMTGGTLNSGNNDEITVDGNLVINSGGTVNAYGDIFISGTVTVNSGSTMNTISTTASNSGGEIEVTGQLDIYGTVSTQGEDLNGNIHAKGGTINVYGPNGYIDASEDLHVSNEGTIYVSQNGTIDVGDFMVNDPALNGGKPSTGAIIIDGTVNVQDDGTIHDTTPDSSLSGSGTINMPNGILTDNEGDNNFICSSGVCIGLSIPLPANLIDFFFKKYNNSVTLYWSTASEVNNLGFSVERSSDGVNFQEISFVDGHGTTNKVNNYELFEMVSIVDRFYYRLKQVDFDGAYIYSKIIFVSLEQDSVLEFGVSPNPTNGEVHLISGLTNYALYNSQGQLIKENRNTTTFFAERQISEVISSVSKGIYFLKSNREGRTLSSRIIKQ